MASKDKTRQTCTECGAGVKPGLDSCPLCGAAREVDLASLVTEHGDYQEKVRKLRDELRRLRQDGAA